VRPPAAIGEKDELPSTRSGARGALYFAWLAGPQGAGIQKRVVVGTRAKRQKRSLSSGWKELQAMDEEVVDFS
jgi:hypothetical protein